MTAAIFQTAKLLGQHLQNHRQLLLAPNVAFQSSFDAAFPFKFHPYATSYKIAENQIAKHKVQGNCILIDAGREMSSLSNCHLQLSSSPFRIHQIV